jgi:integrase
MASITKRGDSYRVLIRKRGYPPISETFPRKSDAEKWARKTESEMDHRKFIVDTKETVHEVFERYRLEVSPKKPGRRWEDLRIKRLLRTASFCRKRVAQLVPQDIQAWRNQRQTEVSDATVNREMNLVSAVFTHALKEWHVALPYNPVKQVARPPKTKHRRRRITTDEITQLRTQFNPVISYLRDYTPWVFEFCIETGLRMGEACRLRWMDVNFDERWIYVLPSKNGDDRYVPLTDNAVALLASVRMLGRKEERVFPVQVGPLGTEFREACSKAKIVDLHFHDSRHEACSRLAKIYTVMELAKIIGHRDLQSLMVYYNPTAAELAKKVCSPPPKPEHQPQPTAACDQGTAAEGVGAQAT